MGIKSLKGFKDISMHESYRWQYIEQKMRKIASDFGYREVRTPILEQTNLFARGVGDTTDIVQKEMYDFTTKGGDNVSLKPEGTAGVVRHFIQHKLYVNIQPTRMYYVNCPVFRYERPQAGRLREHHQFGIECFSSEDPVIDAEVISLAVTLFSRLGIIDLSLHINNIGCPLCKPNYNRALRDYFSKYAQDLCPDCQNRLKKNPMRILDCKQSSCREIIDRAPLLSDYVCEGCNDHFNNLKQYLRLSNIDFIQDERLVRGLDYYTRTAFELISNNIGAQGTVCGGGRYDSLVEQLEGPKTAGIGFGMGMERLLLQMEALNIEIPEPRLFSLYIGHFGTTAKQKAWQIATQLRQQGIATEIDSLNRSMKAQFKYADKINVPYVMILGEEELTNGKVKLRDMSNGMETDINIDDFVSVFSKYEAVK